jgi:hypothetical protein
MSATINGTDLHTVEVWWEVSPGAQSRAIRDEIRRHDHAPGEWPVYACGGT